MASIKGGSLGRTSGKLSNKVYRVMKGKNFVSCQLIKYNINQAKQKQKDYNLSFCF